MACRHWLWGEDKVARGWGETGLSPLCPRIAHAFSVIRRSCLVMRLLRGTGHPLLRGVQRVPSRMQWVPGLSRQTRHAMTPHALRDTLDRTHGLCHRQRSHDQGSQGLSFLIQALHKGQCRVHIGFSFIGMSLPEASLAQHTVNPVVPQRKIGETGRGRYRSGGREAVAGRWKPLRCMLAELL